MVFYSMFSTAFGTCGLAYGEDGVIATALPSQTERATEQSLFRIVKARREGFAAPELETALPDTPARAIALLSELLAGRPADLRQIQLDYRGISPFRAGIYEAARRIDRGQRSTYGELAAAAGSPGAARAVGGAMATNPWPLIVPCHRVMAQNNQLHGFSAPGGIRTKAALLALESPPEAPAAAAPPLRQITFAFLTDPAGPL